MQIHFRKEYHLSKSDLTDISNVLHFSVVPYIAQSDKEGNAGWFTEKHEKVFNAITNKERVYTHPQMETALDLLSIVEDIIRKKTADCQAAIADAPEDANGIILKPKAYLLAMTENYRQQIKAIGDIRHTLTFDNPETDNPETDEA